MNTWDDKFHMLHEDYREPCHYYFFLELFGLNKTLYLSLEYYSYMSQTLAVASDGCGISEVIGDFTSSVYTVGDMEALEKLIMQCMADPDSLRESARKQFEYVRENLTWPKLCGNHVREFESIISRTES